MSDNILQELFDKSLEGKLRSDPSFTEGWLDAYSKEWTFSKGNDQKEQIVVPNLKILTKDKLCTVYRLHKYVSAYGYSGNCFRRLFMKAEDIVDWNSDRFPTNLFVWITDVKKKYVGFLTRDPGSGNDYGNEVGNRCSSISLKYKQLE